MARGFAVFANGGFRVEPYYHRSHRERGRQGGLRGAAALRLPGAATQHAGRSRWRQRPSGAPDPRAEQRRDALGRLTYLPEQWLAPRAISPQNAFLMTDMMSDVIQRGTAQRARCSSAQRPRRQDRHDQRPPRRLVLRLQRRPRRRPPGSASTRSARSARRGRRPHGAADVDLLHGARRCGACRSSASRSRRDWCRMRDLARHRAGRAAGRSGRDVRDFLAEHLPRASRRARQRRAGDEARRARRDTKDDDSLF